MGHKSSATSRSAGRVRDSIEAVVGMDAGKPVAGPSDMGPSSPRARKIIAIWLLVGCALVASTLVLGGVTRLTGSGLSMVDWEPVSGVVPPLTSEAWGEEFAAYQSSPQYREVNRGMSLTDFKRIFWFEYAHRLLGRVIGLVFLLPFLYFLARRMIPRSLIPRLLLMLFLGGAQGLLGWWMVRSGLVDVPRVSAYRLTAHLILAVMVYGLMLWTALALLRTASDGSGARTELRRWSGAVLGLAVVTLISGGFVAGLRAGLVYNTFPKMGDRWVPAELLNLSPWWRNPFENMVTAQFDHRVLAMCLAFAAAVLWWACSRADIKGPARVWAHASLVAVLVQIGLGVSTLLLFVPIPLAVLHQANALIVFTALLGLTFELGRGEPLR